MSNDIPELLQSIEHFLCIQEHKPKVFKALIDFSISRKNDFKHGKLTPTLQGKVLAMIFQKSSLRTRLGFETAMAQLGGHAVNLEDHQIGMDQREDIRDIARVISSMCNGIMARVNMHQLIVELAANSTVPVINGLTDWSHPCQALADMMTVQEYFGEARGKTLAYVGDGNNVARSLMPACAKMGMSFKMACPEKYQLDEGMIQSSKTIASETGATITVTTDPSEAVANADVIYTDVWTSMGQEAERHEREKAFAGYQVDSALLDKAGKDAVVMHCLPAHRNVEIAEELVNGPRSIIFQQAENRLHSQRALLEVLLSKRLH